MSPGFQMWHRWLAASQVGILMCDISAGMKPYYVHLVVGVESVGIRETKYWCACLPVSVKSCLAGFGILAPKVAIHYQLWR